MPRNAIRRLSKPPNGNYTKVPNELIDAIGGIGPEAFALQVTLLRHKDGWETSQVQLSRDLHWCRDRVGDAFRALVKHRRLVVRDVLKDGGGRLCQEYLLHGDARPLTDEESEEWSAPVTRVRGSRSGSTALGLTDFQAGSHD